MRVPCTLAGLVPQKYASPYLCYSVKFGHSRLNCTNVIKEICHQILPPPHYQPVIVIAVFSHFRVIGSLAIESCCTKYDWLSIVLCLQKHETPDADLG